MRMVIGDPVQCANGRKKFREKIIGGIMGTNSRLTTGEKAIELELIEWDMDAQKQKELDEKEFHDPYDMRRSKFKIGAATVAVEQAEFLWESEKKRSVKIAENVETG